MSSSSKEGALFNEAEAMLEDAGSMLDESDKESNICEGYYGSDRSDILDDSDCSIGSDLDFKSYLELESKLNDSSNIKTSWSKTDTLNDSSINCPDVSELPELKNCPPRNSPPYSYFDLFFTTDIWNVLTNETNKFANTPNPKGDWVDITVTEMKKYFALVLNMGNRSDSFGWLWDDKSILHPSFYTSTMNLERFKIISTALCMSTEEPKKEGQSGYNAWVRFKPLLNALNSSFINYYVPTRDISVDESVFGVVPKYKSIFVSYTPKHHVEFGLKKYDLIDSSTGYVLCSKVLSKTDFIEEKINPFNQKAIFDLVSDADLLNKGHHIYIFNAYPKLSLVNSFLERSTYVTANLNKKTKELPKDVVHTKINAGSTISFKADTINALIVGFKRQKNSRYIVTSLLANAEKVKERSGRKYDSDEFSGTSPYLVAVDDMYQAIYDLTSTRCTSKYWRKLLYNLIDVTVLNSYILYKLNTDKPVSKHKFLSSVICNLVGIQPSTATESDEEFDESESSGLSGFLMSDSESQTGSESDEDPGSA